MIKVTIDIDNGNSGLQIYSKELGEGSTWVEVLELLDKAVRGLGYILPKNSILTYIEE